MPVLHRARVGRGTLPEDLLRIELGPIQVSTSRATLRVQDGDLRIITLDDQSNATVWLQDQATSRTEIPLRVSSHLVSAALDLSGAAVRFEARSFYTRVSAPYETLLSPPGDPEVADVRPIHRAELESQALTVPLDPLPARVTIPFGPAKGPARPRVGCFSTPR